MDRRHFVVGAGGLLLASCAHGADARAEAPGASAAPEDVSPAEDLMREHGVLDRVMLIYEEADRRLAAKGDLPLDAVATAAGIVRRFIEGYHEKLEENFLFPRFEKANVLVDLVATLRRQHAAGRVLTAAIEGAARGGDGAKLAAPIQAFLRMYRPHAAREDTVLFPALHGIVSPKELDELGDRFEDEEHARFGKAGFEGVVEQVAQLERSLDLYDLNRFTPS